MASKTQEEKKTIIDMEYMYSQNDIGRFLEIALNKKGWSGNDREYLLKSHKDDQGSYVAVLPKVEFATEKRTLGKSEPVHLLDSSLAIFNKAESKEEIPHDVFDKVTHLFSENDVDIKILFPLLYPSANHKTGEASAGNNGHYYIGEVRLNKRGDIYNIKLFNHDPTGEDNVIRNSKESPIYNDFCNAIKERIKKFAPNAQIKFPNERPVSNCKRRYEFGTTVNVDENTPGLSDKAKNFLKLQKENLSPQEMISRVGGENEATVIVSELNSLQEKLNPIKKRDGRSCGVAALEYLLELVEHREFIKISQIESSKIDRLKHLDIVQEYTSKNPGKVECFADHAFQDGKCQAYGAEESQLYWSLNNIENTSSQPDSYVTPPSADHSISSSQQTQINSGDNESSIATIYPGNEWYTTDEINRYINAYVRTQGGYVSDIPYLLNKKLTVKNQNASQNDENIHLMYCPAVQQNAIAVTINLDTIKEPEDREKVEQEIKDNKGIFRDNIIKYFTSDDKTQETIFGSLEKAKILEQDNFQVKILVPYNIDNNHWTLSEIIIRRENNNFYINIKNYNSSQDNSKLNDVDYIILFSAIQAEIEKAYKDKEVDVKNNRNNDSSIYSKTQFDGHSCGPITLRNFEAICEGKPEMIGERIDTPEQAQGLRRKQISTVFNDSIGDDIKFEFSGIEIQNGKIISNKNPIPSISSCNVISSSSYYNRNCSDSSILSIDDDESSQDKNIETLLISTALTGIVSGINHVRNHTLSSSIYNNLKSWTLPVTKPVAGFIDKLMYEPHSLTPAQESLNGFAGLYKSALPILIAAAVIISIITFAKNMCDGEGLKESSINTVGAVLKFGIESSAGGVGGAALTVAATAIGVGSLAAVSAAAILGVFTASVMTGKMIDYVTKDGTKNR